MTKESVIVIGAGIAGLTTAALLAKEGIEVSLLEAHYQTGGCAGTFKRGPYIFDVGATQVAGFEPGGIHEQIFKYLDSPLPASEILNPGCLIDLCDGSSPIRLFYDPLKWKEERIKQFPGSERFWSVCSALHQSNWSFVAKNPVLPVQNTWDAIQLLKALRPSTFLSTFFTPMSIGTLLKICGCAKDRRLKKFLDLQLKLYSQEPADTTAVLYGSTVLQMSQFPLGLRHLEGSMQKLSDQLTSVFIRDGGQLFLSHRVKKLSKNLNDSMWRVEGTDLKGVSFDLTASDVVCTLPPQALIELSPVGSGIPNFYRRRIQRLSKPSGAVVLYSAVERCSLPENCPLHIQLNSKDPGSLFISISCEKDGRAPDGQATLIASFFALTEDWNSLSREAYDRKKEITLSKMINTLNTYFGFSDSDWLHKELATPKSFQRWTGRPDGIVGGLGQHPLRFGPFGLPSRTPVQGLWICGDSIYPGEGTAGVSQSALMVTRQLLANKGRQFSLTL